MEGDNTSYVKRRRAEQLDSPQDRSRESLFKKFTEVGNKFYLIITVEKEKRKISAGAYGELLQLKGSYDDIFEAVLEENVSLRGTLAESRVHMVRVKDMYS